MTTPNRNGLQPAGPTSDLVNEPTTATPPEPEQGASPEEIEADVERTRQELGETVEELADKLDVKVQARHQVDAAKERAAAQVHDARRRATEYFDRAKKSVTDDEGKPNRNAWIGFAIVTAAAAAVTMIVLSRDRR